jgi:hypothetical protein
MLPLIDQAEAFIRALLTARRRRWRRACLAVVRERRRLDCLGLVMAEQRERQIAERERVRASEQSHEL